MKFEKIERLRLRVVFPGNLVANVKAYQTHLLILLALLVGGSFSVSFLQTRWGLKGAYYPNPNWEGEPTLVRIDNHPYLKGDMGPKLLATNVFSVKWSGWLAINQTGVYRFATYSDDGSLVRLNGQDVVNNGGMHGLQRVSREIQLAKGVHPIEIRYLQAGGFSFMQTLWTPPGEAEKPIPAEVLFAKPPARTGMLFRNGLIILSKILHIGWSSLLVGITLIFCRPLLKRHHIFLTPHLFLGIMLLGISAFGVLSGGFTMVNLSRSLFSVQTILRDAFILGGILSLTLGIYLAVRQGLENLFARPHCRIVLLFFLILVLLGIEVYKDYGLAWDEPMQRHGGRVNWEYVTNGNRQLLQDVEKYHGPFWELLLILLEEKLHLKDLRSIYFMRHLVMFLVFALGVFFFYLVCQERFGDWKIGLCGSSLLVLSPRIFADAFYNSKDLPFLAVFIISIYTLLKFLEQKTWERASLHAVACAILITTRIMGILVPCLTVLFIIGEMLFRPSTKAQFKKNLLLLGFYGVGLMGGTILFFPVLWEGPVHHFLQAFAEMKQYPWPGTVFYLGKNIAATNLPWHYIPVWMLISTPILYICGFFVGIVVLVKNFSKDPLGGCQHPKRQQDLIFVLWGFLPMLAVIVLKSVLYDAWRTGKMYCW